MPVDAAQRQRVRTHPVGSVSNTKRTTLDLLVPRLRVRVRHAWWARMVKLVGTKAVVEGKSKGRDDEGGDGDGDGEEAEKVERRCLADG